MARIIALLSSQGTACLETALPANEDTPAARARVERQYCDPAGSPDSPIPGTWVDVSDNDAFAELLN